MTKPWAMARVRSQQRPHKRSVFAPVGPVGTIDLPACPLCGFMQFHAPTCPTQRKAELGWNVVGIAPEPPSIEPPKQPEVRAGWHKWTEHPGWMRRDDLRAATWDCGGPSWFSGRPYGTNGAERGNFEGFPLAPMHPTADEAMAYADAQLAKQDAAKARAMEKIDALENAHAAGLIPADKAASILAIGEDRSEPPPGWTVQLGSEPRVTWYWGVVGVYLGSKLTRAEAIAACWAAFDASASSPVTG